MRFQRLHLTIVLLAGTLTGVYWGVCAQERPQWAAPTVLPPASETVKYPFQAQPLSKKPKQADPALIVPASVYEEPRPMQAPVEPKAEVIQTQMLVPPPMFPPVAPPRVEAKDAAPLPIIDAPPAPTKPMIVDPPAQPAPGPRIVLPPPVLESAPKPALVAPLKREPTKVLIVDLPVHPTPGVPVAPPALLVAPPLPAPTIGTATVIDPPGPELKSFVRIRPKLIDPPPLRTTVLEAPAAPLAPLPLPALPAPSGSALVQLQVPALVVEKRGAASVRAGETQAYQIVVRNLGAGPAQRIRIDDEIVAGLRLLTADPMPQMQGATASWILTSVAPGAEQSIRLTVKADANVLVAGATSVHVSAASATTRVHSAPGAMTIRLTGPERVNVGQPAVFDIHVANPTAQPLTGIVLYGQLAEGLTSPAGNQIEGEVNGSIAPGDFKILKMPTTALKPGRHRVNVKVVTSAGEATATTQVEVAADAPFVQHAAMTRLRVGRDGELRIDLANTTGKALRNVQVATLLPEGIAFIAASERGLFQANSQTVHWLIDNLPSGATKTLVARINGAKAGQYPSIVSARADNMAETRSSGTIVLEGVADLTLRVLDRDNPLEVGRETVYEIQIQNPGSLPARNVKAQVQFPAGLTPKNAQGNPRFSIDRQTVTFEPIATIAPQGQTILRVSAVAQAAGNDQRVRFSIVSDELRAPLQREVSVMVYSGR